MKITVVISENLHAQAKAMAKKKGVTLSSLVVAGLEREIDRVKPVVFRGNGLTPDFDDASWEKTQHAIYH
ncbi:MAG: hypothetical protein ACK46A_15830 [Akkermansiaceae bacterium]|jgi:hypothetical protein|nr:hypothetical protein [Luteolibacter sp.]